MLTTGKRAASRPTLRPAWLEHAIDNYRLFTVHVTESKSIELIDRFAIVNRRLVSFLEEPSPAKAQNLRDAIDRLEVARQQSSKSRIELPVPLWNIKRASHLDAVRVAAQAVEQVARERTFVRVTGQA